jgi:uncharacterized protein (TIGR02391 family)
MPSTPLLPDDIAESHARLTKLLQTCAQLPFYDVARTLRHAFEQERKKGYYAAAQFMDRLPTYIEHHLDPQVQKSLNASDGLLHSLRGALRLMSSRPENWAFWGVSDLPLLRLRRKNLAEIFDRLEDDSSSEAVEDRQRLTRLDTIIKSVEELMRVGGLAINASDLEAPATSSSALLDIDIAACPLTGLPTRGRATLEAAHDGHILYSFKPIGQALFDRNTLEAITDVIASGAAPLTDWAGLCRQAAELEQEVPVFAEASRGTLVAAPAMFSEKKEHFLKLLYRAGGSEYKERDVFIHDDFPLAFAKDAEEFTRILKALTSKKLIQYDKPNDESNDWVDGVRTHYYSVMLTQEGMQQVENSLEPQGELGPIQAPTIQPTLFSSLTHLHPTIQSAASSLFATNHYPQAILAACTALDKAVQAKVQRPELNGKQLMDVAFTPKNPVLRLSQQDNEQTGFMLLYQGVMLAIRNHYAHNDTDIDPTRALEWLSFISALFYKLDEAQPTAANPNL